MRFLARAMPALVAHALVDQERERCPRATGQSSRSNHAGPCPKGASSTSKTALETVRSQVGHRQAQLM